MKRGLYKPLEKALGYRFKLKRHLEKALTHPSYRYEEQDVHADNQRLEFLGDAALGLVVAAHLHDKHPELQEGELTRLRSRVASRQALAHIAAGIGLGDHLRLGRGEKQSGGHRRPSNLADALEAILGAAYVDGKLKAVQKIFRCLFLPLLENAAAEDWADNPKGALQEHCQQHWKLGPRYRTIVEDGPPHSRRFTVEVCLEERALARGTGSSKREAEMSAALKALAVLSKESTPQVGRTGKKRG